MMKSTVWLTIFSAVVIGSAYAQSEPPSWLYQIVSGRYTECCGFAGPFPYSLPNEDQAFVELTVDVPQNLARMRFLAEDRQTVFHTVHSAPGSGFTFSFSNGMVFPNHIQFGMPAPLPGVASYSYTVSNSLDALRIHGVVNTPCLGCADIPTQFEHANLVAVLVPDPAPLIDRIERGEDSLRFHFAGEPPNDYTVEYTDSLAQPRWLPLAAYRAKLTSIDIVVTNAFTNAPARFFRLRKEPCNCD